MSFPWDLISSKRRAGETAADGWSNHQPLERAVTMGHRAHQHIRGVVLRGGLHQIIAGNHGMRVEHADAVRSVRTMEYHRADKRTAHLALAVDVFRRRSRQAPRPRRPRVRTDTRLDTVDRARPIREAHE